MRTLRSTDHPSRSSLLESREACFHSRIILGIGHQHADPSYLLGLLRARRERPRNYRATHKRDELAALHHSITSSAATSRPGGTVRPRAFTVLILMTVSYLVGTCTGRSAGLAPRRMRSI